MLSPPLRLGRSQFESDVTMQPQVLLFTDAHLTSRRVIRCVDNCVRAAIAPCESRQDAYVVSHQV